ncbi:LOW QUALITY PROTEIN: taste receptor cell protein 1-like [Balaenoptera musculus]|uniref:LOW QUALITY PROTEIN: taste receptor cell protein 1-like n=1 Tax=Balaenoptera musculus TaxID=9771 RepID=A0A8B8WP09_BALMU|nr:LOW QUALITY PROTEIN: taste receptor cell protein 1-like [Balaenoptera musculus]
MSGQWLPAAGLLLAGPSRVTRSVTFRITNEAFSAALGNPASLEYQLLSENIRHQLQSIYHEAFSSFQGVSDLLFRPDSAAVNASLVFGGPAPGPSACEVLWTLYRKVKAAEKVLGNLSLDESSLASDGSNLTDLALETISIRLTAMRPFQPPLLLPGSAPFVLLEKTILRQVAPVVSGFYTAHPQEDPLLLFSNADQWVGVYIEYKFQTPIGTHPPGLAINHLAWNIMDPAVQKSSIMANAEKAEMVQYEVWLQILDQPFTKALRDKSGPKSQQLRGMLTRWVKWGRGERREEQEAGGFMCGDPTRLQYSCDPLHPLCSPADHHPQASAELRPSGGEVPVRPWWLWVTWGPGLNSRGGASGSEKWPS